MQARYVAHDVEVHGQTVAEDSIMLLLNGSANRDERHFGDDAQVVVTTTAGHVAQSVALLTSLGLTGVRADGVEVSALLGDLPPERVTSALVHGGIAVAGIEVRRRSLEQLFVGLTGEGFDVAR